jgi:ferredoxin-NADP reductase/MOSC domain-containing protein YiiM/ferredoxin
MTARLLSVNVGRPREVQWEGKTVRTAIWKDAVEGPQMVRHINIDGDDQGDRLAHGGEHRAVFVYQIESYRYWERELGRDDFTYGQFGENFTVEDLPDDTVCIGDRYRIGEALFEVTQPRVTCYRVGIRMKDPALPTLLVAHHRPGFYFRVLEEGMVQAGDAIAKVADGPEQLTVADVDGLLYLPHRSRPLLERALKIPALSEGWQGSFRELLAKPDGADEPAWAGFQPLRVAEVRRESATVTSFRLVPEGEAVGSGEDHTRPGQYVTVRLRPDGDGAPPLVRSYSLSDVPGEHGYRISVKRDGAASHFLHERIKVGDVVDVAAPRGSFALRAGERPVVLVSAGVGATPVLAMLHHLAGVQTVRPVWWLHGARDRAEHAFAAEVDELLAELPDAHRLVAYSRPEPGSASDLYDITGHLDLAAIDRAGVPREADYYVCGPDGFMEAIGAALTARGVPPECVATEAFGAVAVRRSGIVGDQPPPHQPDGPPGTGASVTFVRSNIVVDWDDRFPSLLDLAEACDVPIGFGCRNGVCHTCESSLLAGAVDYTTDPLEPPPEGRVLVCCSRPAGELTLDL